MNRQDSLSVFSWVLGHRRCINMGVSVNIIWFTSFVNSLSYVKVVNFGLFVGASPLSFIQIVFCLHLPVIEISFARSSFGFGRGCTFLSLILLFFSLFSFARSFRMANPTPLFNFLAIATCFVWLIVMGLPLIRCRYLYICLLVFSCWFATMSSYVPIGEL